MIKLIAFDWNGTLLDDIPVIFAASNLTRKYYGYKPISLRQYQKTITIPIVDYWLANGGKKKDMNTQHNIFYEAYERLLDGVTLRKGAGPLLSWLKKNNIQSVIYSNHTKPDIVKQLKGLRIYSYFTSVLARESVKDQVHLHRRHKGDKLKKFIKESELKPEEVISVGDTVEEIEVGKQLGLHSVAITGGENSTVRLKFAHPNFLIFDLSDIKKIIITLNSKNMGKIDQNCVK